MDIHIHHIELHACQAWGSLCRKLSSNDFRQTTKVSEVINLYDRARINAQCHRFMHAKVHLNYVKCIV